MSEPTEDQWKRRARAMWGCHFDIVDLAHLLETHEAKVTKLEADLKAAEADRMRGNCKAMSQEVCDCGLCKRESRIAELEDLRFMAALYS